MALDIYDLAKLAAICIDNGGRHIPSPGLNMDMDGNPFLKDLYDRMTKDSKYVIMLESGNNTFLMGILNKKPSDQDLKELNSMNVWFFAKNGEFLQ